MRILVVDDDSVTRLALASLFSRRGFEVSATTDAEEAYDLLQRDDAPRLAIIDWALPGMSGLELCRKLRDLDRSRRTHVIMLTVKTGAEDVVAGLNAGADDYVRKPFDIDELYARVRAAERLISLEDQLRFLADVDELTGLLSRSAILDVLRRTLTRGARESTPVSIALVDVDRFKQINDRYGHGIGDAALRGMAKLLDATLRPYDSIGRYGGEEFLIVLPGCGPDEAFDVGERIRRHAAGDAIATAAGLLELTVSIGLATAPGGTHQEVAGLIDSADQALYHAKHAGRNRVAAFATQRSPATAASENRRIDM